LALYVAELILIPIQRPSYEGAPSSWHGTQKTRVGHSLDIPGPQMRGTGGTQRELMFVLSHPSRKNKDAARVGQPALLLGLHNLITVLCLARE
jgi:hypothetical protein